MRTLSCLIVLSLCLWAVMPGCAVKDRECLPNEHTVCKEGVTYWTDSCGNQGDVAEECDCGCDSDFTGCESPCECIPNCDGRECGSDGCQGSCGECTGQEQCNPAGQCVGPGCGNGLVEGTEQCDGDDFGDQTCLTAAGHQSGELSCTGDCYLDLSGCYTCGNYSLESVEDCDGNLLGDDSCWSFGYYPAELACTAACTYDLTNCIAAGRCGDDQKNGPEECDGTDLAGADCVELGYNGGQLSCTADCRYLTSQCSGCGPDDPCQGIGCSGHGLCLVDNCLPYCDCDPGYYAPQGELRCLEEGGTDPCEGEDCSGHGHCDVDVNLQPFCICDDGYGPGPGGLTCTQECDWITFDLQSVTPNLLLVVDRSGSMQDPLTSQTVRTKLEVAQEALLAMLETGQDLVRFGLLRFPSDDACGVGQLLVECSELSVPDIRDIIQLTVAQGGGPTGPSLEVANQYQGLHDTGRANYLMLLTDGLPNCPNGAGMNDTLEDAQLALAAVQELYAGSVETMVVGLGEALNSGNIDLLIQMAVEGGRPLDGDLKYYAANSPEDLGVALGDVLDIAVSCNLNLVQVPGVVEHLWVTFDGLLVGRDTERQDGWDYDADRNQLLFYGSACQRLRFGEVTEVNAREGCLAP